MSSPPNPGLTMRYASSYVNTIALAEDVALATFTTGMLKRKHDIDIGTSALMIIAGEYNKLKAKLPVEANTVGDDDPMNVVTINRLMFQIYGFLDSAPDCDFNLMVKMIHNRDSNYNQVPAMSKEFYNPTLWAFNKFRTLRKENGARFDGKSGARGAAVKLAKEVTAELSSGASF